MNAIHSINTNQTKYRTCWKHIIAPFKMKGNWRNCVIRFFFFFWIFIGLLILNLILMCAQMVRNVVLMSFLANCRYDTHVCMWRKKKKKKNNYLTYFYTFEPSVLHSINICVQVYRYNLVTKCCVTNMFVVWWVSLTLRCVQFGFV